MRRLILIPLLIVLAVLAIAGGVFYLVYQNYMLYSTDDAQVSGTIINVNATAAGKLTTLTASLGQRVTAGDTIATITTAATSNTSTVPGATPKATTVNITSPINGTILQVSAVAGQDILPQTPILEVTDLNNLSVTAYVDEGAINNISKGQAVDISIDAYKDTKFSGHVQQIVQAAAATFSLLPTQDNASGNFTKVGQRIPVIITLDGTNSKDLVPGMSATVMIHLH